MALGLLRALHGHGRRVPEDVSVVGFDDIPEASSFLPPLTTLHQDFAEVGRLCVQAVLRKVRQEVGGGHHAGAGAAGAEREHGAAATGALKGASVDGVPSVVEESTTPVGRDVGVRDS